MDADKYRSDAAITVRPGRLKMNVYEACRHIRDQPWAKVVATGWGRDEDRCGSREAGFDKNQENVVNVAELSRLLAERKS